MTNSLKAKIIRVGNSHAIRIPKLILDQLRLGSEVEMTVQSDELIIRSAHHNRAGWDQQFQAMAASHDDQLYADVPTEWDDREWEW
jgi:antitoxin MazE